MVKKLRILAIILGLSGAAFSCDNNLVEPSQDNQVEGFLTEGFSLYEPPIEESETMETLVDELYMKK